MTLAPQKKAEREVNMEESMAREEEFCTFEENCTFKSHQGECSILRSIPKPRKDGRCPFGKELPGDIGGETPYRGLKKWDAEKHGY